MTTNNNNNYDEEKPLPPQRESSKMGIRLSALPANIRASLSAVQEEHDKKMSCSGNGNRDHSRSMSIRSTMGHDDIVMVVDDLGKTKRDNQLLKKFLVGMIVFAVLLIGCIFGASIAASRLARETVVDPLTGIAYASHNDGDGTHAVLKTESVVLYSDDMDLVAMTNSELMLMKEIVLMDGGVKFLVKGYSRSQDETEVLVVVEDGSLTFDSNSDISDATGIAETMLQHAFGNDNTGDSTVTRHHGRYLPASCSTKGGQVGSGSSHTGSSNNSRSF